MIMKINVTVLVDTEGGIEIFIDDEVNHNDFIDCATQYIKAIVLEIPDYLVDIHHNPDYDISPGTSES